LQAILHTLTEIIRAALGLEQPFVEQSHLLERLPEYSPSLSIRKEVIIEAEMVAYSEELQRIDGKYCGQ
jgi:hypothetical protein